MPESDLDEDLKNADFLKNAKPGSRFTFIHNKNMWPTSIAQRLVPLLNVPTCCVGHYIIVYDHIERTQIEEAFSKINLDHESSVYILIKITVPSRDIDFKGSFLAYKAV
jgi:hypothetical protein